MTQFGDILYHRLTEEPVMILHAFRRLSLVRRPIMGQNGIRYKYAFLWNSELETLQEQTARTIANIQARSAVAEAGYGTDLLPAPAPFSKKSN